MDGVIVRSEPAWRASEEELIRRRGINIRETNFRQTQVPFLIGRSQQEAAEIYKKFFDLKDDIMHLRQERIEIVKDLFQEVPLMSGVYELIECLFKKGYLLGLATSSPMELVDIVFERFRLGNFFKAVVVAEMAGKGKPAPNIYLKTAELLGVEPSRCLVFEDAINGLEAAKKAGMRCIMIPNNFAALENLAKADWIIESFCDIDLEKIRMKGL